MRALVYEGPYTMPLKEVADPVLKPDQIMVQVKAVGICGSDVHGYRGTTGRRVPPIIMGHEFSGVIVAVGSSVTGREIGDRVVISPLLTCGVCESCLAGKPNICQDRHCLGVDLNGSYAEYISVHHSMVHALPDSVSFEQGAMVEPLAVSMHAVNQTPFDLSATVVIIGAGTIGLLALLCAKMKGAGQIILVDTDAYRLEFAKKLGATHTINSNQSDPVQMVKTITDGVGADAVFEAVGISATANQSLFIAKNGGNVTWIGNSQPEIQINMQQIVTRDLHLRGSYGFTTEFDASLEAIRLNRIDPMVLVEKEISFAEASQMIDDLSKGKEHFIKVLINQGLAG